MAAKRKLNLKIGSWNCGMGFTSKGKIFELQEHMRKNNLSICAVSEVTMTNTTFFLEENYNIDGYNFFLPKSWKNIGTSRMILYIKNDIMDNVRVRGDIMTASQPDIWIDITLPKSKPFTVGFYYRERTGLDKKSSPEDQYFRFKEFLKMAAKISDEKREVHILGDFNINLSKTHNKDHTQKVLKDLLLCHCTEHGLTQIIRENTRKRFVENRLEESLIDHIYTNKNKN